MMKKQKRMLQKLLFAVLCCSLLMGLVACGGNSLRIDAPETVNAESGLYTSPEYQVVDADGKPVEGMTVRLKSVSDPDGKNVVVTPDGKKFTANKAGTYTLIYTADDKKVKDAEVRLNVTKKADPPTILIDEYSEIQDVYINGFTYYVPYFTFSSDADLTKSWMKIWHIDGAGTRTEIKPENNQFTAAYDDGSYEIVIHAENADGVSQEFKYTTRAAAGPQEKVEGKIGYFDDPFGIEQFYQHNAEMRYTTEKAYEDESGSLEVVFKSGGTGIFGQMRNLIQKDVSEYDYLVYRVFNPNDFKVFMVFSEWFGYKDCDPGVWTEIKVPVEAIIDRDGADPGSPAIHSLEDITGLVFMAYHDYKPLENGNKIYLSALYAVKTIDAPEEIIPGKIGYFDEMFGAAQFEAVKSEIEFVTEKAFGEEAGSLKVTFLPGTVNTFGKLIKLTETDMSSYDYLILRVFNPNTAAIWFSVEECEPNIDVKLIPGEWTEVKIPVSRLVNSEDLTNLDFRGAQESWASLEPNTVLYLSAMYAVKEQTAGPSEIIPGKLGYFDEEYGEQQFAPANVGLDFNTEKKHDTEQGSLQLTIQAGNNGTIGHFQNLTEEDLSTYTTIEFYVFNAWTEEIWFTVLGITDVKCSSSSWTKVTIEVSKLTESGKTLEEVELKAAKTNWAALDENTVLYLSSIFAV